MHFIKNGFSSACADLVITNVKINKIDCSSEQILINAKNFTINSQLNIAADGKNSFVKRLLKTPFFKKKYNKKKT